MSSRDQNVEEPLDIIGCMKKTQTKMHSDRGKEKQTEKAHELGFYGNQTQSFGREIFRLLTTKRRFMRDHGEAAGMLGNSTLG